MFTIETSDPMNSSVSPDRRTGEIRIDPIEDGLLPDLTRMMVAPPGSSEEDAIDLFLSPDRCRRLGFALISCADAQEAREVHLARLRGARS